MTGPLRIIDATPACNVGPAELTARRRAALLAAGGLAAWVAVALALGGSPAIATIAIPLYGATVTLMQWRLRFCVGFGLSGRVGMGEQLGSRTVPVELRRAHRRRAISLAGAAALPSLLLLVWLAAAS